MTSSSDAPPPPAPAGPTRRTVSWCRHCGRPDVMTAEHVPARSTGNDQPVRRNTAPLGTFPAYEVVQAWEGGHAVPTLCNACNQRGTNFGYVAEYRKWFEFFLGQLRAAVAAGQNPLSGPAALTVELPYDFQPARFVRQVIGNIMAVQHTDVLVSTYPQLMDLVAGDPDAPSRPRLTGVDPSPLRLYMSIYNGTYVIPLSMAYLSELPNPAAGHPTLWTPPAPAGKPDDAWLLGVPPFAFVLTTKGAADLGTDVTDWVRQGPQWRPPRAGRHLTLPGSDALSPPIRGLLTPERLTNDLSEARARAAGTAVPYAPPGGLPRDEPHGNPRVTRAFRRDAGGA